MSAERRRQRLNCIVWRAVRVRLTAPIDALLADKGYGADTPREKLANARVEAAISAKPNRRNPAPHDYAKYRWRNHTEKLFNKLKNR